MNWANCFELLFVLNNAKVETMKSLIPEEPFLCSDSDLADACVDYCSTINHECIEKCSGNRNCILYCDSNGDDCFDACPCFGDGECLTGCSASCSSSYYQCRDFPESTGEFILCQNQCTGGYAQCAVGCDGYDYACFSDCTRTLEQCFQRCPCQEECPRGCPCPAFQCSGSTSTSFTTETTPPMEMSTNVLILNTFSPSNRPLIINASGELGSGFTFSFGDKTEAYRSCSITWQKELFVFGGRFEQTQISKVIDCQLRQVGELPFTFDYGACANIDDDRIYLCFYSSQFNHCRVALSPTDDVFAVINQSLFNHRYTRIASKDGIILAVGDYGHCKAELLITDSNSWSELADYPFVRGFVKLTCKLMI